MKKIAMMALVAVMVAPTANAGLLESLGLKQKEEPKTLAEACNTDELKNICPEVLLGTMTMAECLKSNAVALSKQCSDYVKKSIADGAGGVLAAVEQAKADANAESDAAAAERAAKAAEVKEAASETIESAKRTGSLLKSLF